MRGTFEYCGLRDNCAHLEQSGFAAATAAIHHTQAVVLQLHGHVIQQWHITAGRLVCHTCTLLFECLESGLFRNVHLNTTCFKSPHRQQITSFDLYPPQRPLPRSCSQVCNLVANHQKHAFEIIAMCHVMRHCPASTCEEHTSQLY